MLDGRWRPEDDGTVSKDDVFYQMSLRSGLIFHLLRERKGHLAGLYLFCVGPPGGLRSPPPIQPLLQALQQTLPGTHHVEVRIIGCGPFPMEAWGKFIEWWQQHPPPVGPRGLSVHTDQLSSRPEHMGIWHRLLSHAWTHLTELQLVRIPNTACIQPQPLQGCWPMQVRTASPLRILRLDLRGLNFTSHPKNDPLTALLTCLLQLEELRELSLDLGNTLLCVAVGLPGGERPRRERGLRRLDLDVRANHLTPAPFHRLLGWFLENLAGGSLECSVLAAENLLDSRMWSAPWSMWMEHCRHLRLDLRDNPLHPPSEAPPTGVELILPEPSAMRTVRSSAPLTGDMEVDDEELWQEVAPPQTSPTGPEADPRP